MTETLYLIDGYAAIFRAYYAIRRPLYSAVTGEQTQAVLVFAQMLLKLYTRLDPDYVVFALDAPGPTFRDALYAQYPGAEPMESGETEGPGEEPPAPVDTAPLPRYKGTRQATPDGLWQQIPRILELLEIFGVPVIGRSGLEADDVIATLTDRVIGDHPDLRVRIVSRDKDLEQLLGERVTLFDIHTEAEMDVAALREKRGVSPAQIVDLLTLTGDAVDNIPGVPGIGPRTAARLVNQFGSLDGILENLDQIPERWRGPLEQSRPVLPLTRRLITLERDPTIPFSLEAARARPLPTAELAPFFDELGFTGMKSRLPRTAAPDSGYIPEGKGGKTHMKLAGRTALITGADSGIGQAIAITFAREGADIAIHYGHDREGAERTAEEVRKHGRTAEIFQADLAEPAQAERLFGQAAERLGRIDILVNNAGAGAKVEKSLDTTVEEFVRILNIDLISGWALCRAAAPGMIERGRGVILNVTSVHEEVPGAGGVAYNTAKGGLRNLSRSLALELAPQNVRVVNIAPGMIATPMNAETLADPEKAKEAQAGIPMRRAGQPEEVASLALFLASDDASYITGSSYFVDGGWMQSPSAA